MCVCMCIFMCVLNTVYITYIIIGNILHIGIMSLLFIFYLVYHNLILTSR